jgi:ribose 5-phosphate isomerase A
MSDPSGLSKQTSKDAADLIESAKRAAAQRAVDDYFDVSMRWVGIGSGTTIQYVVEAIKEKARDSHILFVPTGFQSRNEIEKRGLIAIDMSSLPENVQLDVAFDGADEVDEEFNCVKGGGACLFQEKLVAMRAKKFVCVAGMFHFDDARKGPGNNH